MADPQAETVQIVVEVVDKFSKPLNDLKRQIEGFGKVGEHAGKVTKEMVALKEAIESVSKIAGTFVPNLGTALAGVARIIPGIGTGILAIGAAMTIAAKAGKDWIDATHTMSELRKETGLTSEQMKGLQNAARFVGVSTAEMQQGFRNAAEQMYETRRGMGTLYDTLRGTGASSKFAIQLAEDLRHTADNGEFVDKVLQGIDRTTDVIEKKRIGRAFFGPPGERIAMLSGEERRRQAQKAIEEPTSEDAFKKADEYHHKIIDIELTIERMNRKLGEGSVEALDKAIQKVGELKGEFDKLPGGFEPGAPGSPFTSGKGPLSGDWWRRLIPPGGGQGGIRLPQGFQEQEQIKKPIKQGFVEGLEEYFGPADSKLPKGAMPTSFSPGGGIDVGGNPMLRGHGFRGAGGGGTAQDGADATPTMPVSPGGQANLGMVGRGEKGAIQRLVAERGLAAGLPASGVAAIMGNITPESNWNPASRHGDQPRFRGEAHFAHGLFQEGGDEWNNYVAWMKDKGLDPKTAWTNPGLQTDFVLHRLSTAKQYRDVWRTLKDPNISVDQKALMFQGGRGWGYLRPGIPHSGQSVRESRGFLRDLMKNMPTAGGKVEGNANLRIDLNGFPANTRTGYATSGDLFGNVDVTTNRGFTAPNASETE